MLLSALMSAGSCNSDEDVFVIGSSSSMSGDLVEMDFAAAMEQNDHLSKAALSIEGASQIALFSFSSDDSLSVFQGSSNVRFDYNKNSSGTTVFSGVIGASDVYYALFPYNASATISGNVISTEIPAVQNSAVSDFSSYVFSVGYTNGSSAKFNLKNACSLIWIDADFSSCKYSKITLEANKNISGKMNVIVDSSLPPEISDGTSNTISIANPCSGIVPVVPQNDVDLRITFERTDGSSFAKEYKGLNLSRSDVAYLSVADGHFVNFDSGIDNISLPSLSVSDNSSFTMPGIYGYAKPGMNFVGWKSDDGTIYPQYSVLHMGDKDISFSAEWSSDLVVSYNVEGAPIQKYELHKYGDYITLGDAPLRAGYDFKGWLVNGFERKVGDQYKVDKNLVIEAVYEPVSFTIKVLGNGGLFYEQEDKSAKCAVNGKIVLADKFNYPVRKGYEFGGYYDNPTFDGSPIEEIANPTEDMVIYSRWYKLYYIHYVDSNGDPILDSDGNSVDFSYSELSYYMEINDPTWYGHDGNDGNDYGYGWQDQDGKEYNGGERILFSTLDEFKDITFTLLSMTF